LIFGLRQKSFHSLRERVTFFAGAKKVTKETPFFFTYGVFADRTSCPRGERRTSCAPSTPSRHAGESWNPVLVAVARDFWGMY
jgi:hypothetical protein